MKTVDAHKGICGHHHENEVHSFGARKRRELEYL